MKKLSVEWIEGKDKVRLWIDDEHGINFEIGIKKGEVVSFTQLDGHKAINKWTRKQMEDYIQGLCALLNRYNIKKARS